VVSLPRNAWSISSGITLPFTYESLVYFSGISSDAYQMINILRKIGLDPQAIEQPLDLSIPENKMMLAFYLAAPEVENDRRALNTFSGMRRAMKEGRYLATAPFGYVNRTLDNGRKVIAPVEGNAELVKMAFEEVAKGTHHIDNIREQMITKGFSCSKSNFYTLLRNPLFCGKIAVPAYRDEPRRLVQGQHEAIISEKLFYEVQIVLDKIKDKRIPIVKVTSSDSLPLRGYLLCPKCDKQLTGSASKGRNLHYHYYHCTPVCGIRYKAEVANEAFAKELKKFVPKPGMVELFKFVINDIYRQQYGGQRSDRKDISNQIQLENDRLTKARKLLLEDALDGADYRIIKTEAENRILSLEAQLTEQKSPVTNMESLVNKTVKAISQLSILYKEADTTRKRAIVGSIFPEKLVFDGLDYRTARVNEAARLMYLINSKLYGKKNRTNLDLTKLSDKVAHIVHLLNHKTDILPNFQSLHPSNHPFFACHLRQ
jgi:site-specific DNA recombinase